MPKLKHGVDYSMEKWFQKATLPSISECAILFDIPQEWICVNRRCVLQQDTDPVNAEELSDTNYAKGTNAMARKHSTIDNRREAQMLGKQGTEAYESWDIDKAVKLFEAALRLVPNDTDMILNLAKALARGGDFDRALQTLAEFLRLEPESPLANRFEQLFASGMDPVEHLLTKKMSQADIPIEEIGAAIQMWLAYRITLGREPLVIRKPDTWAAALDYTVRKVNLRPVSRREIASLYGIGEKILYKRHSDLVRVLDIMPCDYRYFTGENNPLDKLVEAAEMLEQLEARFREP